MHTELAHIDAHVHDDQVGASAYQACVSVRHVESVDKILRAVQADAPRAYAQLVKVPLEQQFPACAIDKGYGATYGVNTSNNAEVAWTMLRAARSEKDMYEQFVRTAAVMQHHYMASVRELARATERNITIPDKMLAVKNPGPCMEVDYASL